MNEKRHPGIYLPIMAVLIALGLPARVISTSLPAWYVLYFGDYLWAMLLFFGFALVFQKMSPLKVGGVTLLFTYAIEISQLFHPQWLQNFRSMPLFGLILGYGFLWSDILAYTLGIASGVLIEYFFIRHIPFLRKNLVRIIALYILLLGGWETYEAFIAAIVLQSRSINLTGLLSGILLLIAGESLFFYKEFGRKLVIIIAGINLIRLTIIAIAVTTNQSYEMTLYFFQHPITLSGAGYFFSLGSLIAAATLAILLFLQQEKTREIFIQPSEVSKTADG